MNSTQGTMSSQYRWKFVSIAVLKFVAAFIVLEVLQIVAALSLISSMEDISWLEHGKIFNSIYTWIWICFVLVLTWRWKHRVFWLGLMMVVVIAVSVFFMEQIHFIREKKFGPYPGLFETARSEFHTIIHLLPGFLIILTGFLFSILGLFRIKKRPPFITLAPSFIRKLPYPLGIPLLLFLTIHLQVKFDIFNFDSHSISNASNPVHEIFFIDNAPEAMIWRDKDSGPTIWNLETGREAVKLLQPLKGDFILINRFINECILADITWNRTDNYEISFIDLARGEKTYTLNISSPEAMALGPRYEFWTVKNGILEKLDCRSGTILAEVEMPKTIPDIQHLSVSSDGLRMLIRNDKSLHLLDAITATPILSIKTGKHESNFPDFGISTQTNDLSKVFLVDQDEDFPGIFSNHRISTELWDTGTGSLIGKIRPPKRFPLMYWMNWPNPNPSLILSSSFSPDGALLLTCSLDGTARIYEVHSQKLLHAFTTTSSIPLIKGAISRDNSRIIARSDNGNVFLWDIESGDLILQRAFWKEYGTEK